METAQFHRAMWNYDANLGIGKIHYEKLGVIAFLFENNSPVIDVNFLDADEVAFYNQKYKKLGHRLLIGVQIDRDVDLVRAVKIENFLRFSELNLEVKAEEDYRFFRQINGEWQLIKNAPLIQYQRCDSLICVNHGS